MSEASDFDFLPGEWTVQQPEAAQAARRIG